MAQQIKISTAIIFQFSVHFNPIVLLKICDDHGHQFSICYLFFMLISTWFVQLVILVIKLERLL